MSEGKNAIFSGPSGTGNRISASHVLIIDELGYLSHAAAAANVLYRAINERYLHRRPILLTPTNRWRR